MTNLRRFAVATSVALLLCSTALAGVAEAAPVSCGQVISQDTTLAADVGPCPGAGLIIDTTGKDVTLDLGGHTVVGAGDGSGIAVFGDVPHAPLTHGAASIRNGIVTGFSEGIYVEGRVAVQVERGDVRDSCVGINVRPGASVTLRRNTITGSRCAGVVISGGGALIENNIVTDGRGSGIVIHAGTVDTPTGDVVFRANVVSNNGEAGIDIPADNGLRLVTFGRAGHVTIVGNEISGNGGDGVHLERLVYSTLVQGNVVKSNARNGVSIDASLPASAFAPLGNRILGNVAVGNSQFDLSDANADCLGGTWSGNRFGTRDQPCIN